MVWICAENHVNLRIFLLSLIRACTESRAFLSLTPLVSRHGICQELWGNTARTSDTDHRDIWDHMEPCLPCEAEESRRTRGTFGVILCIPKSLLGVIEPCFPRNRWTPAYPWEAVNVIYMACVQGFHFICYILFISTHKFSHFYFSYSPPIRGLSWLVLIQGLQNTLTLYATFFYMSSGNFTVVAKYLHVFLKYDLELCFQVNLFILADEANLAQFCKWNWTRETARVSKFPKTMDNQGLSSSLMELTRTPVWLQLLINCWGHFPISVWVSGSLLAWLLSC